MQTLRMEDFPNCILCGLRGEDTYTGLPDRLYGISGLFNFRQCRDCGLLWLDPRPVRDDIGKCYQCYHTHIPGGYAAEKGSFRSMSSVRDAMRNAILCGHYGYRHLKHNHILCRFGPLLAWSEYLRYRAVYDDLRERFPPYRRNGLILDVGCGSGDYLERMKGLGWNVLGIEPDPVAAGLAQSRGIPVITETLEKAALTAESADQITMNHVLEHLPDPFAVLSACLRILKKGGRLVIYTPNHESLGHRLFKADWRGLEPPRHLFVYSSRSMEVLLKRCGFQGMKVGTTSCQAKGMYDASVLLSKNFRLPVKADPQKGRLIFSLKESILNRVGRNFGEEVEAVACKS